MELYATCAAGLEAPLGRELSALGMEAVRPLTGGVSFAADLRGVYTALLWSRVASRILLVVDRTAAADADALYEGVCAMSWEDHIGPDATIAVSARGTNDELRDTRFTALRVKDAICDRLRDLRGARPDVDAQHPDVRIQVNLHARRATVYVDLSGSSLEDRGYRASARSAIPAIRETLAAGMLVCADWPARASRGDLLVDSMCAAGTVAIEAACMAADIAPGIMRSNWGFTGWLGHDEALWDELIAEADQRAQDAPRRVCVLASDADAGQLACARTRAKAASVAPFIDFAADVQTLWRELSRNADAHALFASRLFVGLGVAPATLPAAYALVASDDLAHPALDGAVMLVDGEDADAFLGMRREQGHACMNGSVPCDIAVYDLAAQSALAECVTVRDATVAVYDASAQQFADRLNKMRKARRKWAGQADVHAYRVYDADLPDYNMAIDLYQGAGPDAGRMLVHVAEYAAPKNIDAAKTARRMTDALNIIRVVFDCAPYDVFVKRRVRSRGGSQYAQGGTVPLANANHFAGDAFQASRGPCEARPPRENSPAGRSSREARPPRENASGRLITAENGLLFEVDLASYLDTGLFLDHRDTRALVGRLARGKSFLNLFAYTCTASVYAAAAGARFTTSVDLSNTYLAWGQRNMELNGLMNAHQEFVRADCVEWVNDTRHSRLRWDLVFVDPPTFSSSSKMGKRTWDVQRDHAELLIGASRLLTRGGAVVFSCNLRGFKLDFETLARAGVQAVDITEKTIPGDFERNASIHHCFVLRRI